MTIKKSDLRAGKAFDIVLYGATGFTGRLVAECLVRSARTEAPLRWAMAGRNMARLEEVHALIGSPSDVALFTADTNDPMSLAAMALRTRVVLSTVGPYQLFGAPLIQACVDAGTDYLDLCGEPGWMREIIDAHHQQAQSSGSRIVFSCGFDSIPFDCGVYQLQKHHDERFGYPASRVRARVRAMKGSYSGGTAASLQATMDAAAVRPELRSLLGNPFALTPEYRGAEQPDGGHPYFDDSIDAWVAPFIMAPINTKNIHRSNFLLDGAYGRDFQYDEMLVTGTGETGRAAAEALRGKKAYEIESPLKPGEGPDLAARQKGFYDILFLGAGRGEGLKLAVKGDQDPGYGSTSKMITQAALCLMKNNQGAGGVWTPAALMGDTLVERLQANAGVTFTLIN